MNHKLTCDKCWLNFNPWKNPQLYSKFVFKVLITEKKTWNASWWEQNTVQMLQLPRTDWDNLSVWIFKCRFVHICITSAWKTIYCCSAEPSLSPLSSDDCFEWSLDVLNILHWFTWLSLCVADNAGSDICMNYWCQYIAIAFILTVACLLVWLNTKGVLRMSW